MCDGFPLPDFGFDDTPLMALERPANVGQQEFATPEFQSDCLSLGMIVDPYSPIRSTGNSSVFKAQSVKNDKIVWALKASKYKSRIAEEFQKRKNLADSRYLVKSYELFDMHSYSMLQMELCHEGDITGKQLTEGELWLLIHDIGCALMQIHAAGWMHLDISPSNILVDGEYFKLADFGTLVKVGEYESGMEGAGPYCSPETMLFTGTDDITVEQPTDIFSFGVVLLESATGYMAPRGGDERYGKLRSGEILLGGDLYACECSQELIDVVNAMISPDPSDRPTAADLVNHPFSMQAAKERT